MDDAYGKVKFKSKTEKPASQKQAQRKPPRAWCTAVGATELHRALASKETGTSRQLYSNLSGPWLVTEPCGY